MEIKSEVFSNIEKCRLHPINALDQFLFIYFSDLVQINGLSKKYGILMIILQI